MNYNAFHKLPEDYRIYQSIDLVILGYNQETLSVLLRKTTDDVDPEKYSLLGQLVPPDQDLDDTANELFSNYITKYSQHHLEQVHTFGEIGRHHLGRVITTAYYSFIWQDDTTQIKNLGDKVFWVPVKEISNLAYDHEKILDYCLNQMKSKLKHSPLGFKILPKYFSLGQVQKFYETIFDKTYDKRNFRKKLLQSGTVKESGRMQDAVSHRPARLYYFKNRNEIFEKI